jgi:hypothetical protein
VPEAAVRSNNLVVHYETGIAVQHLYMYILISFSNDSPRSYPARHASPSFLAHVPHTQV